MTRLALSRRRFLTGAALASTATLAGCFDPLGDRDSTVRNVLETANSLTYRAQRLLLGSDDLAREYSESEIRQPQRPNGSTNPRDADYLALANQNFAPYRLKISGLVETPVEFSLDEIRAMPSRTQITRHDCVEGWSCIAKWTGAPLASLLQQAKVKPAARFVLFECFDTVENGFSGPIKYYESIDLRDALHPQTILAYGLNGDVLPVANGSPLRVRVERQLGYKMAKYIRSLVVTDDLHGHGDGGGGYWEDRGYEWFAGI
ncbi:molybdopterin-dependent oxidoreductase [Jiella pacifica]|uniref:Molybdopterin-dependent oxidoreductase n=1 Tax=Jiella pacifica TaxID=2696469 RepID=A0A6N9TEH7_9HYPH|nr:molybdopterin-dependent oxidoreductase [Jiella pacifica]NDW07258.1 molybdopterin-dependent oxidoreductase [Jiella pacifica]